MDQLQNQWYCRCYGGHQHAAAGALILLAGSSIGSSSRPRELPRGT
jgi:uncharacterized protein YqgC (DUF456 family)